MINKIPVTPVFQPLQAVPGGRPVKSVIETIAITVNQVRQAVTVQIRHFQPAATPMFVRRLPCHVIPKVSVAEILKYMNLLDSILGNDRGKIRFAIPIKIRHRGHDRAGFFQQRMAAELPVAEIFHPLNFPIVVTKLADDEVEAAIAQEVHGAHVCHPGNIFGDHMVAKTAVT